MPLHDNNQDIIGTKNDLNISTLLDIHITQNNHEVAIIDTLSQTLTTHFVIPLYKKGKKSNPVNYRPILLICIYCQVILYYLWKHPNANNIIFHHQHVFETGRSCQTQLVDVVHNWVSSTYNHKQTYTLLCDFYNAIDTVPHTYHIKLLLPQNNCVWINKQT